MKTILTTLNAKYIHTSPALRWLYVANKDRFDVSFKEYIVKDDIHKMADELLSARPDIIGMGIYIWNVTKSRALAALLKARKPSLILIAGGPEVSYEPEFFLNDGIIDFVISGEGEFVLGELLETLSSNNRSGNLEKINIESISHRYRINKTPAKADLEKLSRLPSPYRLDDDRQNRQNRYVYFETSRGCPYQCHYCLSSLEKGVRFFPLDYVFQNLEYLINNNARQVKFTDRTFNLNQDRTRQVFDFLITRYKPGLSFQFEIYPDLLTEELIDELNNALPPHYFRFEIGIQSTFEPTNRAIDRKQNFALVAAHIQQLMEGQKVDLHLDLIAGLPYESYDRFKKSFNEVFALGSKEVQLGFLKMLRGTAIRRDADLHGYLYNPNAPYEIFSNKYVSSEELKRLRLVEFALDIYWNSGKLKRTMQALFDTVFENRYFELFDEIGQSFVEHPLPSQGYLLEDIFRHLHRFLQSKEINLFDELRKDYYSCFKIRPHGFWENRMDTKTRKRILHQIANDKPFLSAHGLNRYTIEKQATIDLIDQQNYLLTVFSSDKAPLFLTYPLLDR